MSRSSASESTQRAIENYGIGVDRRREKIDDVGSAFSSKDLQNKSREVFLKTLGINEQAREKWERAQSVITGTIGATAPIAFPAARTLGAAALKSSAGKAASKAVGAVSDQVGEAVSSAGRSVVSSAGEFAASASRAGSAALEAGQSALRGGAGYNASAGADLEAAQDLDADPFPAQSSTAADVADAGTSSTETGVQLATFKGGETVGEDVGKSAAKDVGEDIAETALPEAEEAGISLLGDVLGPIGILAGIGVTLGLEISNATKKSKQDNPDNTKPAAQVNFNPSQYGRVQRAVAPSLNAAAAVQNAPTNF